MTLTTEQITAMCQRGFGTSVEIGSIQKLGGGTFNTTYLITFASGPKVILRVAPLQTANTAWEDAFLMRSEHAMQPFFAPIAALMPRTLLVDFTHQLIDRDYMFQTFTEGKRWDDTWDDLLPEENALLWHQFGEIMKQIHEVRGERFGLPRPGFQFERWSETVIDRMERTLRASKDLQLGAKNFAPIIEMIRAHPEPLDEIQVPRLLHGDLWLFNLLIERGANGPAIVGVLDADRSWWGDPMADWTMFILAHAEPEEGHHHFWQAYGRTEDSKGARFRKTVYDGMHAGIALVWSAQHKDEGTMQKAQETLGEVVEALPLLF
ncbi:MAG TPA: phosphotransferase [Anaerolineales bacterium]|nr:phosphotransferase [Anaerolineales bacterium]